MASPNCRRPSARLKQQPLAHLLGAEPTQYGRSKPSKAPPLLALYLTTR